MSLRQAGWAALAALLFALGAAQAAPAQVPNLPRPEPAGVNFNFDNADLRLVIRLAGEITGRRFVIDDKVAGTVTVVANDRIPADRVYPFLLSILEARGFSVIEREGASYVVPLPEGTAASVPVDVTGQGQGLVTRIFHLKHIDAAAFARMIEPMVRGGKQGAVAAFAPTNHLIVTDTSSGMSRILRILEEMDQPGTARTIEVVPLQHASADELAAQVMAALGGAESAGARVSRHMQQVAGGAADGPADVLVVPASQANRLVLVGSSVQIAELKRIIAELDTEPIASAGRLNAIFLKYLPAEDAAKSLTSLLSKTVDKDQRQRIAIEPNTANNALIIDATARDFQWVKSLIESLDIAPQQVLVEVLIAEVSLGKQIDLGVEWATLDTPGKGEIVGLARSRPGETDTILDSVTKGIFPQGLAIGVANGTNAAGDPQIPFLLRALQSDRDVNILSSVPLLAQNNVQASVSVVENIPILKSTIEGGSGTARDVIQNIDRIDVGIKLKITPRVNPNDEITMVLNPSIEAIVDQGSADVQFTPTIAKREVSTTITLKDRATVVISGLIRQDKIRKEMKVPLLGDIPYLGALFRYSTDQTQRTNLLIFVTPHIVRSQKDAEELKLRLQDRTTIKAPAALDATTPASPKPE